MPASFKPGRYVAIKKYRSPHANDLSFSKGDIIQVTGLAPKDDEEEEEEDDEEDVWLVGQSEDGSKSGTFPARNVVPAPAAPAAAAEAAAVTGDDEAEAAHAPQTPHSAAADDDATGKEAQIIPQPDLSAHRPDKSTAEQSEAATATGPAASDTAKPVDAASPLSPSSESKAQAAASSSSSSAAAAAAAAAATAPTTSPSLKSSSAPEPSKSPPPPAPKPGGLAARIAAFNKPAENNAPPLPRPAGKPGGWKRPPAAPGAPKPLLPGQAQLGSSSKEGVAKSIVAAPAATAGVAASSPPTHSPTPTNAASQEETSGSVEHSQFSAADAQASIKMTLKERMAALQRGGGAGAGAGAGEDDSNANRGAPPLPANKPGRLAADRRNIAMQGMGLAPPEPARERKESVDTMGSAGSAVLSEGVGEGEAMTASSQIDEDGTKKEIARTDATLGDAEVDADDDALAEEGKTEEEQEAQRRAAIAARLAKLGGRRMGGGPAAGGGGGGGLFGGPPMPPSAPKPRSPSRSATLDTQEEARSDQVDDTIASPSAGVEVASHKEEAITADDATVRPDDDNQDLAPPKTLAVPRRAAPPRRKRSAVKEAKAGSADATVEPVSGASPVDAETNAEAAASTAPSLDLATENVDALAALDTSVSGADKAAEGADGYSASPLSGTAPSGADLLGVPRSETDERRRGSADTIGTTKSEMELRAQAEALDRFVAERRETDDSVQALEEVKRAEVVEEDVEEARGEGANGSRHQAQNDQEALKAAVPTETGFEPLPAPSSSSRPPSTRPPIPRSSLPPPPRSAAPPNEDIEEPIAQARSPPPTRAPPTRQDSISSRAEKEDKRASIVPPIPKSPPPAAPSDADSLEQLEGHERRMSLDATVASLSSDKTPSQTLPLAAPRARHGIVQEESDEEEERGGDEGNDEPQTRPGERRSEERGAVDEPKEEQQELSEEQQEAQRRAAIARRMAALGGQRMGGMPPIMGAPMPPRRKASEAEVTSAPPEGVSEAERAENIDAPRSSGIPRGGVAIPGMGFAPPPASSKTTQEDVDEPSRLASPPPRPASKPPPMPTSPPLNPRSPAPPSRTAPSPAPPSRTAPSPAPDGASIGRRASIRPPVPTGLHSRATSEATPEAEEETEERDAQDENVPQVDHAGVPLHSSPQAQNLHARSPSVGASISASAASASLSSSSSSPPPPAPRSSLPPTPHEPRQSVSLSRPAQAPQHDRLSSSVVRGSSRDLDLLLDGRWWRRGADPLQLPPTLTQRPDVALSVQMLQTEQAGERRAQIEVRFEDASRTMIRLEWFDEDAQEERTQVEQSHNFPPPPPTSTQMQQWSATIGAALAHHASAAANAKAAPIPRGGARGFINSLIQLIPDALPPAGSSFGISLLALAGATVLDRGADAPRAGDVIALWGADLKGKRGLASYHVTYGTTQDPALAVIVDPGSADDKKNKMRADKLKGPEEVSIRLDDLKSGVLKIFRVPSRAWIDSA
ncbi:Variant SH3 domain [Ceraceosorus bombacis]|uniref:Variant SH3 domain n=1 Tax=Ceraceosorus bombacis TaxID=401625 RepID=A0A0N7LB82_9BASI|nr:Variant SH3 domain [Ceraceosorus bombacis]